jgi:prevent-host-death family protein
MSLMTPTRSIGSEDARTHFYRLLDDAASGEPIIITGRGKPVARLIPIDPAASKAEERLREIREVRKGITLGGASIRDLIDEGRK